jgi:3-phosphoshikimate 1-carboxyvinyltransferase
VRIFGTISLPGDKSISHRIALISILAKGECRVDNYATAQDAATTLHALKLLGGSVREVGEGLLIRGMGGRVALRVDIDCQNSGTTMRLLMGILAGLPGDFGLDGDASLRGRPMERVARPLRQMGASVECPNGKPPVRVRGGSLKGIDYALPMPSAQLKSALLLAGIQASEVTRVLEPIASRDHTERLLAACGAKIRQVEGGWAIEESLPELPPSFRVPGDISSAAFFVCGAAIVPRSEVIAEGVLLNPTRTGFVDVLKRMGAQVACELRGETPEPWGNIRASYSPELRACELFADEIPLLVDEVPILSLVATQALGTTVFHGVGELRVKESDRLVAIASQLGALGARIRVDGDELVVEGPTPLRSGGPLESFGDHRIAMTLKVAGLLAGSGQTIKGDECVGISFPNFEDTLRGLVR